MAISCVYCNGTHADPADVRACWQRAQSGHEPLVAAASVDPSPVDVQATQGATPRLTRRHPRLNGDPDRWAGPTELGRWLVLVDCVAAPAAWQGARRIVVDDSVLAEPRPTVELLRAARLGRERVVVELTTSFHRPPDDVDRRPLHEVGPRGELHLDELHHLVWSNSVVHDIDGTRWPLAEQAVGLGAEPTDDPRADVVVPGLGPVLLDGGSLCFREPIDGVPVVPAIAVEHGSLRAFGTNSTDAALADDQLAAVTHTGVGARIIAPAGSGKTRVLTERARHLVTRWGIPASAITLVAYNRRAQAEMQARLADVAGLQVRTLNSLALAIVNGVAPFAPRPWRTTTLDERDVRRLLDRFVPSRRVRNVDPLAPWLEALSAVRLGLRSPEDVEDSYDGDVSGLAEVFPQFEAALDDQRAFDFDGQIVAAIRVLLTDPVVRRAAQRACRVLLVDEFQDLTPAHLLLIRLLAGPERAVFGVGDDDQTIYGYNGADPAWLIDYHDLFPGSGEHPLEVNYRCPGDVVTAVDHLLRHNRRRVPKLIRAHHADRRGLIRLAVADPLAATVDRVVAALDVGRDPRDIAVLARVNVVLVPVQVALTARGIGAATVGGPEFLDRTAIRSSLAWLRLATSPGARLDPGDLALALQRPSRSLHPRVASWVGEQRSLRDLDRLAGRVTSERDAATVAAFAADVERVRAAAEGSTAEVLDLITETIGLAGTLATFDRNRRGMNTSSQRDDLVALAQLATLHDDVATFPTWLAEQLTRPRTDEGVTLATVHRVKGQEWPLVIVHLADEGQFPHRLADDHAEERRLFHVALTRASDEAVVVSSAQAPSPFLIELDRDPPPDGSGRRVGGEQAASSTMARSSRTSRAPASSEPAALDEADSALFAALRELRDRLRRGKPAYTVFDNATLLGIVAVRPATLAELARVRGVGPAKLEQYGQEVLAVVAEHGTGGSAAGS